MPRTLIVAVLLASTGCFDLNGPSRGGQGEPCWTDPQDDPCEPGLQCRDGVCRTPQPEQPAPSVSCVQSLDCSDGEACIEGVCHAYTSSCDSDSACRADFYCSPDRVCQKRVLDGQLCGAGNQCLSTFCADGVCCNSVCDTTCYACTSAKSGATDGVCSRIPDGTDPDDECHGALTCNGQGACALHANGTPCTDDRECQSSSCTDGVCCSERCDGACRHCSPQGVCGVISSAEDAGVCDDSHTAGACATSPCTCDSTGACKSGGGVACTTSANCVSGQSCVDGVCCNTPCAGTCEACVASKTGVATGTCAPILNGQDPDNECGNAACNGTGACHAKSNGVSCRKDYECSSGHCFIEEYGGGYCCERACDRLCESCLASETGGLNGSCRLARAGKPNRSPIDLCPQAYRDNMVCDGSQNCIGGSGSRCRNPSTGSEDCLSGVCVRYASGLCQLIMSAQYCGACE